MQPPRGQRGVQPPGVQRQVQPPGGQRGVNMAYVFTLHHNHDYLAMDTAPMPTLVCYAHLLMGWGIFNQVNTYRDSVVNKLRSSFSNDCVVQRLWHNNTLGQTTTTIVHYTSMALISIQQQQYHYNKSMALISIQQQQYHYNKSMALISIQQIYGTDINTTAAVSL